MKYILAFILFFLLACSPGDTYSKLEKLSGTWKAQGEEGINYEKWSKAENGVMHGQTIEPDSTVFGRMQLVKTDSGIFYIPHIKGISLKLTTANDSVWFFERTDSAYPQKIIYRFIASDSMIVTSAATVRGEPYEFTTHYRRMK